MDKNFTFTYKDLLEPEIMIKLYARGAFPMADESGEINWYSPEIRTIIPLDNYNVPRSLRKFMEKSDFEYRYSTRQLDVIKECANRKETWISNELIEAYKNLISLGYLHSVEVYQKKELVGGLYGVTFGGAFFGESMFSKVPQASKSALVKLIERLYIKNFLVLDVQYLTEHLQMFGAVEIPFIDFGQLLSKAYLQEITFL
jgi:leucyl/phenylalanyl-tRNA--protein transferase